MFRAMTLNLNYLGTRHGAWPRRRPLVVQAIRELGPDVVALQAVWRTAGGDSQADELARELPGYYVVFEPAMEEEQGAKGLAFLARTPLEHIATRALTRRPGIEDPDRRIVLRARVRSGGGEAVTLYNVHLSWVREQAADNVREALSFVNDATTGALLLGDFNLSPDSPLHERLRASGWTDAWTALRGDDPGFTFEADRPSQRIDYVYANASLAGRLRAVELVARGGADAPRLSDHLGIVASFDLA